MSVETFNPIEATITVTPAAAEHLKIAATENPDTIGFRLSTNKTGCSGLSYVSELISTVQENDIPAESNSPIPIYISKDSLGYLNGLTVDFVKKDLGQSQLIYTNPNETGRCGCGESFTIQDQDDA